MNEYMSAPVEHNWTNEEIFAEYVKIKDKKKVAKMFCITVKELNDIIKIKMKYDTLSKKRLDPKVFLVIGDGICKAEFFQNSTKRIVGYSKAEPNLFPVPNVCTAYAAIKDDDLITALWSGLLCAVLLRSYPDETDIKELALAYLGEDIYRELIENSNQPERWIQWMRANIEKREIFLVKCDSYFAEKSHSICIVYDGLDQICSESMGLAICIRALLHFWFIRNNDWRSLKAKIFLRSDLYNADVLHFMDASKIKAYLLDLSGCTNRRKD